MIALLFHHYPVAARSDRHGDAQDINSRVYGWQAERIDVRICQARISFVILWKFVDKMSVVIENAYLRTGFSVAFKTDSKYSRAWIGDYQKFPILGFRCGVDRTCEMVDVIYNPAASRGKSVAKIGKSLSTWRNFYCSGCDRRLGRRGWAFGCAANYEVSQSD